MPSSSFHRMVRLYVNDWNRIRVIVTHIPKLKPLHMILELKDTRRYFRKQLSNGYDQ